MSGRIGKVRDLQNILEVKPIRFGDGSTVRSENKRGITDNSKILPTNLPIE